MIRTLLTRRGLDFLMCAAAWLVCFPAVAQPARTYAVLSLAADRLTIVVPQITTGSSLDRNMNQVIPTPDDSLDIVAVQEAERVIQQHEPGAAIELYSTQDPKIYAAQGTDSRSEKQPATLLSTLKPILSSSKATHLLLIIKHRDDARFNLAKSTTGIGKLSGLGFYVDNYMGLYDTNTGNSLQGFVAPYAVLKFQLVELAGGKITTETVAQASSVYPGKLTGTSVWADMTAETKARALERMIQQAVADGVARILTHQ